MASGPVEDDVDDISGQVGCLLDEYHARCVARVAGVEVSEDVLGDDPAHARLIGGGPHHEAAAEGETEQGDVVQVEIVEDGGDGLVPLGVMGMPSSSAAPWPGPSKATTSRPSEHMATRMGIHSSM